MPVAKVEESEPAQPIVDGDNNHVGFHQRARVVVMPGTLEITDFKREYVFQVFKSSYLNKGAAMNPDHHGHGLDRFDLGCEHVEVETILDPDHLPGLGSGAQPLRTRWRWSRRFPHIAPGLRWHRPSEPEEPNRRPSIRHAPELVPSSHLLPSRDCAAFELTLLDLHLGAFADLFLGPLDACPWSCSCGRLELGVVDAGGALAVVPRVAAETFLLPRWSLRFPVKSSHSPFGEQQGPTLGAAPSGSHCPFWFQRISEDCPRIPGEKMLREKTW